MGLSRRIILLFIVGLSFVLPAALCAGLAIAPARTGLELAIATLVTSSWMVFLVLVNWWEFTSVGLRWAWLLLLGVVLALRLRQGIEPALGATPARAWIAVAAFAMLGTWMVLQALLARRHNGKAVNLSPPLSAGRYLVTDGGDGSRSFFVNYHYGFGRHRRAGASASMRYAMDIVAIGRWGGESRGFLPRRNDAYLIWGRPLLAPCEGVVIHVVQDVEDNSAFGSHRPYGVGNHVVIRHQSDIYVVLGHMRHGCTAIRPGDPVRAGDVLGQVGNSGWTERPHLHLQAMRSETADWWRGEPLPIRFGGKFLVRNQVLHA